MLLNAVEGRVERSSDDEPPEAPIGPARVASGSLRGSVLLAEDTEVNQEVASALLEDLGCRVRIVSNGRLAVEAVKDELFDIVLMDCQMPELDGFGATELIRSWERQRGGAADSSPRLPIVAVTAHAMQGNRDRCIAAGMDDFLTKPFSRSVLAAMVTRWVRTRSHEEAPGIGANAQYQDGGSGTSREATDPCEVLDAAALDELAELPGAEGSGLVQRVVSLYLETAFPLGGVIREAARRADAVELSRSAHRLKSSSLEIGAQRVATLCDELEQAALAEVLDDVDALAAELEVELARLREKLESRVR